MRQPIRSSRAGFSIVEAMIAATILGGVLLAMSSTATGDASGRIPVAYLLSDIGGGMNDWNLDTTAGFPEEGLLIVDPGNGNTEWVRYCRQDDGAPTPHIKPLERGVQCTSGVGHKLGSQALWAGLGLVVSVDAAPPAAAFDGISREGLHQVYFRGLGTGFSYRTPVDPTGSGNLLQGINVNWGAEVGGAASLTSRAAMAFAPMGSVSESDVGADLNNDGDTLDVFDRGSIVRHVWDESGQLIPDQASLGSNSILQERCNWGGDLDGDGFDDPIFLWNAGTGRLRVRYFMIDTESQPPQVNRAEGVIDLLNAAENEI
jgi:hypothetical protein